MLSAGLRRTWRKAEAIKTAAQLKFAGSEAAKAAARRLLVERLGRLHGLPQKLGQMLSFSWNVEEPNDFAPLQNEAQPTPLAELLPSLERAWQKPVSQVLRDIDSTGLAASIGQVHRATLRSGVEVAVKIQYPGIRQAINDDLKTLGWLSLPMGGLGRGFDLAAYQATLRQTLDQELDYRQELESQSQIIQLAQHDPTIQFAAPITEFCTSEVLVTRWLPNTSFDLALPMLSSQQRVSLGDSLLRFFLRGLLGHGLMQADWHPGNIRLTSQAQSPQWALLDFGATCQLTPAIKSAFIELFTQPIDHDCAWSLLLTIGFDPVWLSAAREKLPALCKLLAEPFHAGSEYDLQTWRLSSRMSDLLGDDRWNFRIAAPAALLPVMRAFHGLIYYLTQLGGKHTFRAALEESLGVKVLSTASLDPLPKIFRTPTRQAQLLKVRVKRDGKTQVQLSSPANAATRLDSLLDPPLLEKIEQQGVNLCQIQQSEQAKLAIPGSLFSLVDDARSIDVWLE